MLATNYSSSNSANIHDFNITETLDIQSLPPECLAYIFKFLQEKDKLSCALVCRLWYHINFTVNRKRKIYLVSKYSSLKYFYNSIFLNANLHELIEYYETIQISSKQRIVRLAIIPFYIWCFSGLWVSLVFTYYFHFFFTLNYSSTVVVSPITVNQSNISFNNQSVSSNVTHNYDIDDTNEIGYISAIFSAIFHIIYSMYRLMVNFCRNLVTESMVYQLVVGNFSNFNTIIYEGLSSPLSIVNATTITNATSNTTTNYFSELSYLFWSKLIFELFILIASPYLMLRSIILQLQNKTSMSPTSKLHRVRYNNGVPTPAPTLTIPSAAEMRNTSKRSYQIVTIIAMLLLSVYVSFNFLPQNNFKSLQLVVLIAFHSSCSLSSLHTAITTLCYHCAVTAKQIEKIKDVVDIGFNTYSTPAKITVITNLFIMSHHLFNTLDAASLFVIFIIDATISVFWIGHLYYIKDTAQQAEAFNGLIGMVLVHCFIYIVSWSICVLPINSLVCTNFPSILSLRFLFIVGTSVAHFFTIGTVTRMMKLHLFRKNIVAYFSLGSLAYENGPTSQSYNEQYFKVKKKKVISSATSPSTTTQTEPTKLTRSELTFINQFPRIWFFSGIIMLIFLNVTLLSAYFEVDLILL